MPDTTGGVKLQTCKLGSLFKGLYIFSSAAGDLVTPVSF